MTRENFCPGSHFYFPFSRFFPLTRGPSKKAHWVKPLLSQLTSSRSIASPTPINRKIANLKSPASASSSSSTIRVRRTSATDSEKSTASIRSSVTVSSQPASISPEKSWPIRPVHSVLKQRSFENWFFFSKKVFLYMGATLPAFAPVVLLLPVAPLAVQRIHNAARNTFFC